MTATLEVERRSDDSVALRLAGEWKLGASLPTAEEAVQQGVRRITFDASGVTDWDTGLIVFLVQVVQRGEEQGVEVDRAGLPDGVRRILDLAFAVPEKQTGKGGPKDPFLARVGKQAIAGAEGARDMVT
ncbi:MAG: STAS domain-containing protein, partial [Planctomycetota bacterium]|nr:STAS domain-containing protein [Planctomycetota bacterium]